MVIRNAGDLDMPLGFGIFVIHVTNAPDLVGWAAARQAKLDAGRPLRPNVLGCGQPDPGAEHTV
jgi:hypothetical protein